MKNLYLLFLIFMGTITAYAQKEEGVNEKQTSLSPNGILDDVFDHYGRKYKLSDLIIAKDTKDGKGTTAKTTLITCNSGYFNLYFETGCGMEIVGNPTHDARRAVVCKVFEDLSNFINSPLSTTGKKVNIWIRNINNVITAPNTPNGVLGLASSFYTMPYNTTSGFGGIVDNEVWKTIHTGNDSYTNVSSPLSSTGISSGASGIYYHGMAAFNFNTTDNPSIPNNPAINWHTNLSTNASSNLYDLYTVLLHEGTHALGFASLINGNGSSKFGPGYNYYSRYDRFLKNSTALQFLLTNTNACSSMYNYSFNSALNPSILAPNASGLPCNYQTTVCRSAIRYVGLSNVPVFTPNCFQPASSLSHFEDQCISAPNANNNNSYFTMADAIGTGMTKRYLKPEERNVLCDLGYTVNTTFGSSVFNGTFNYGGTACSGIKVAGTNDGINSNGAYSFVSTIGANITLSGLLNNDTNATSFECLQDVFSAATFSATSGTAATSITYNTNVAGVHLLRYVPVDSAGQRGNITYVYVYVGNASCATTSCNIVNNGTFENSSSCGEFGFGNPVPTVQCWSNVSQSPDIFKRNCTSNGGIFNVGVNTFGSPGSNSHDGAPNDSFVGFYYNSGGYKESIQTTLSTPLTPGQQYTLSFWAKVNKLYTNTTNVPIPVDFSSYPSLLAPTNLFPNSFQVIVPGSVQLVPTTLTPNDDTWHFYSYTFTFPTTASNHGAMAIYTGVSSSNYSYVFVDDVNIVPLTSLGTLDLPAEICLNETIPNLASLLSSVPTNGVFSGPGISLQGGSYTFTALTPGVVTITYTYTNNLGCQMTISDDITVLPSGTPGCRTVTPNCPTDYVFSVPEPASLQTYQASNTITTTTNYVVPSGYDITLTAGKAITIKAMTHIQNGAVFLAKIQPCSQFMTAKKQQVANIDKLRAYPNPASSQISIESAKEMTELSLISIEGRVIVSKKVGNTNFHQLDIASYQNGIYILTVKNSDGTSEVIKIIKQ